MRELFDGDGAYEPSAFTSDTSQQRGFTGSRDPSQSEVVSLAANDRWYKTGGPFTLPPPPTDYPPFWGLAYGSNTPPTPLETLAGRPVGMHRIYGLGSDSGSITSAINLAKAATAAGRVPWLSFPFPDTTDNMVNAGVGDAWAVGIYNQCATIPGPALLTFNHEGNLKTKDPNTLGLNYAKAHDRLYLLKGSIAPNCKMGPITTGYEMVYSTTSPNMDVCWPGAMHADFFGLDAYNRFGVASNPGGFWRIGTTYFTQIANFAASKGIGWAIAEYGLSATGACYNRHLTGGSADGLTGGLVDFVDESWTTGVALSKDVSPCYGLCWFNTFNASTTNVAQGGFSNQVGQPAWLLDDQSGHIADHGTPSKQDHWLNVLNQSPLWRPTW